MVTRNDNGMVRVTVTLDPIDVDLIDRLAALEGQNRSMELRGILRELRPMLTATVEAFEAANAQRDLFTEAAAEAATKGLEALMPEVEALQRQYMGAMSRIEGLIAAAEEPDPRPSSHGGHTPTPTSDPTP
uniref:ribbon-helix-helix protein, CopG family n=1 Tax=Agromyces terreus TaxID=424795 RepID=UPI0022AA50E9